MSVRRRKLLGNSVVTLTKKPVVVGAIILLVVTVILTVGMPVRKSLQARTTKTNASPSQVKTASSASTASQAPTLAVSTSAASSNPSQTTSSPVVHTTQTTAGSSKSSPNLYHPVANLPAMPSIKLSYTSSSSAHMVYFYSYGLVASTYKFVVQPIHTQVPMSNFYADGYLQINSSGPNAEPSQSGSGNPVMSGHPLSDGDEFTLSICSYEGSACVVSSNTIHLTISADASYGAMDFIYNYSQ